MLPAIVMAAVLVLAGCTPTPPSVTPEPVPSSTPVFASDEDALAAATAAYAKYLEVSDQITADGGKSPDRIAKFVTSNQLVHELDGFKQWSEPDDSSVGSSQFDTVSLQRYDDIAGGKSVVVVYLCVDVSAVRIMNAAGTDVTPATRPNRYPLEVEFDANSAADPELVISRSEPWSGNNFCQ
ncbi:MAG: hypothetical protein ABIW81_04100 [Terrimesophilobacter sp.]